MKINLPNFKKASVLVVGDVMLDRYWYGSSSRISPEAPVPIVKIENSEERPGGAANVAMNIAMLGCRTYLVGIIGVDDAANILKEQLSKANVVCNFISVATHPTITKLRVISHNQQLIRLDFEQSFNDINISTMIDHIQIILPKISVVVLSDYAKGSLAHIREIIMCARAAGIPVLVDPKGKDFARYRGAMLLTPNMSEFESVTTPYKDEETLVRNGMKLISDYQLSALLITRSEQGMTLLQMNKNPIHLPAYAQEVYDVTGAGDTVISVLAATLASSKSLEEACFLANAAAGIVIGKLGASAISNIELTNIIHNHLEVCFGIMTENELKKAVVWARKRGEKIVMTNGIFDILHAGHVRYLANARQLGNRLIVAVNSDESTKHLKGKNRPVNPLEQRMAVLAALKSVDWVVSFNENTPQRLIANLLPDILVKGGDYQSHQIAGNKEILDNGGDVLVLNFEDGCSTTNIINSIKFEQ